MHVLHWGITQSQYIDKKVIFILVFILFITLLRFVSMGVGKQIIVN